MKLLAFLLLKRIKNYYHNISFIWNNFFYYWWYCIVSC